MRAQDRADQERPRDLGVVFSRVDEALDGVGELGGRHIERIGPAVTWFCSSPK